MTSQKVFRTATFRWLQALDHALRLVTGFGWEQFASGDTDLSFLSEGLQDSLATLLGGSPRTRLVVADQHSCGPSGISFLQAVGNQLMVDLTFDPPHRMWNFDKLGLLYGDGWEAVLLTTIPYTINDGPWGRGGSANRLRTPRTSTSE